MSGDSEKVGSVSIDAEINTGPLEKSGAQVDAALNKLNPSLKRTEKNLTETERAAKAAAGSITRLEVEANKLRAKLESLSPGTQKFIDTAKRLGEVEKRLAGVRKAAQDAAGGTSVLKSTFAQLTGAFTVANLATMPITSGLRVLKNAFIGSIKDAMAFETILARISTVADGSTKESIGALRKEIIELSKVYPKSKEELGTGLYNILQAGIEDTADAMHILKISTEAAIGGSTEVGTVTKVLTDVMGAYGMSVEEAGLVLDKLFVGAREGKAEVEDLATSLGNVLASAARLDIDIGEVVAAIETMVNAGLSSDEATTSLNALFTAITQAGKGTGEAYDEAQRLGLEFDATALRTKGLQKFMEDMTKAVGDDEVAMQILAGNVRGFRAAAAIGGDGAEYFTRVIDEMSDASGASHEAFLIMANTTEAKWTKAVNAASNAGEAFGGQVLPELGKALDDVSVSLNNALPFFQGLGTLVGIAVGAVRNLIAELPNLAATLFPAIRPLETVLKLVNMIRKGSSDSIDPILTGTLTTTGGGGDDTTKPPPKPPRGPGNKDGDKEEKDMTKQLKEQVKLSLESLKQKRVELELREKLGVITKKEARDLKEINRMVEFQDDVLDDMVDKWEDQQDAIEGARKKLEGYRTELRELDDDIAGKLTEIDRDASRDRIDQIAELIREQNEIREQATGAFGMSGDMSRRLGEIDSELSTATVEERAEGERRAGLGSLELTTVDAEQEKADIIEENKDRREELLGLIEQERGLIEKLEQESVQAQREIVKALDERAVQTDTIFTNIEARTEAHVNTQIEQFNRLKSTLEALTVANSSVAQFESQIGNSILPGFKSGGFTGEGNPSDVAGVVHKKEFVVDAPTTAMYRPMLEAMRARNISSQITHHNERSATISVNNYGRAAEAYASRRRARWDARTYFD